MPGNILPLIFVFFCTKLVISAANFSFTKKYLPFCVVAIKLVKGSENANKLHFQRKLFCQQVLPINSRQFVKLLRKSGQVHRSNFGVQFFTIDRFLRMFWLFSWWTVIGLEKWVYFQIVNEWFTEFLKLWEIFCEYAKSKWIMLRTEIWFFLILMHYIRMSHNRECCSGFQKSWGTWVIELVLCKNASREFLKNCQIAQCHKINYICINVK